jgi:hypothetical protein
MKAETPRPPASGSVLAKTTNTSASGPLVAKILVPDSRYSSPSRTATVCNAAASEPAPGSVIE